MVVGLLLPGAFADFFDPPLRPVVATNGLPFQGLPDQAATLLLSL